MADRRNKSNRGNLSDIKEFSRRLREYESGEIGKLRFRATYQRLRNIVNRRLSVLEAEGLESGSKDELEFYLMLTGQDKVGAYSKQEDPVQTYRKMLRFIESPFSSKATYSEAQKYYDDYVAGVQRSGGKLFLPKREEFIKFIANGDFAELARVLGNSPTAFEDAESLFNEGVTYEAFSEELEKFVRGDTIGYDEMLDKARKRMREDWNT